MEEYNESIFFLKFKETLAKASFFSHKLVRDVRVLLALFFDVF